MADAPRYGSPEKARRELYTLTVDLPREVEDVTALEGDRPPLVVYGPIKKGQPYHEADMQRPHAYDINGVTVDFHFDPPIKEGRYRALAYIDRFKAADGEPFDIFDERTGAPWTGWFFDILESTSRYGPAPPHIEQVTEETPEPVQVSVHLDGSPAPDVQASGEVLTVITSEPADVSLNISPLIQGRQGTLYEKFLTQHYYDLEDGRTAVSFVSTGPVDDYKWAKYYPMDTMGRLPLEPNRSLLIGEPVMRRPEPAVVDPHMEREETIGFSKEGHENSYTRVRYHVTPQNPESFLTDYTSRSFLSPEIIHDQNNTPDRNAHLFPNAIYREDVIGPEALIGTFDLPLQSRIQVMVNGRPRRSLQTRLVPLITSPSRVRSELDMDGGRSDEEWLEKIWRASMVALRLWGCSLPANGYPTPSMTEFVFMYLLGGPERMDGAQGTQHVRLGPQTTITQSDRAQSRRLANLADMLADCIAEAPFDLQDHVPSQTVGISAGANHKHYGPLRSKQLMRRLLPMYTPYETAPVTVHPHDKRRLRR